jgi:biopolymer transport protein ExbB
MIQQIIQEVSINLLGFTDDIFVSLFVKGGIVVYFLFFIAVLIFFITVQKYFYLLFFSNNFFNEIEQKKILFSSKHQWIESNIKENLILKTKTELNQNIDFLALLIKVASLLGLLGTIVGMIEVFTLIGQGQDEIEFISLGISKATIPTFVGMAVSIIGLLILNLLKKSINSKINNFISRLR